MFRKEKDTSSGHYSYALAGYSAPLQCASMGYFRPPQARFEQETVDPTQLSRSAGLPE
jgi:hypothetical protein